MKRLLIGFVIFIIGCLSTDVGFTERSSTSGAIFLKQAMGTRAAGMGEAFCAVADDLSAVYYNPAGLVQLNAREPMREAVSSDLSQRLLKFKNRQLTAMYLKGLVDTGYSFLGYEQSLNIGGIFGVNMSYILKNQLKQKQRLYQEDRIKRDFQNLNAQVNYDNTTRSLY